MELLQQPEQAEQPASSELLKRLFQRAPDIMKQYGRKDDLQQQTTARFHAVHNGVGHVALYRPYILLNFHSWDRRSLEELEWTIDQDGNVPHGTDLYKKRSIEPPSAALVQGVLDYFEREDQRRRAAPPEFLRELFRANIRHTLFLDDVPTNGYASMKLQRDGNLSITASPNPIGPFDWVIDRNGRVLHGKFDWWDPGDGIGSSGYEGGGTEEIGPPNEALVRDILAQLIMDRRYTPAEKSFIDRCMHRRKQVVLRTVVDMGYRKLRTLMDVA